MTEEDLRRARALPHCVACGKQSDGAIQVVPGIFLCGTDYDAWKRSAEGRRAAARKRMDPEFNDFVTRVQASARNAVAR